MNDILLHKRFICNQSATKARGWWPERQAGAGISRVRPTRYVLLYVLRYVLRYGNSVAAPTLLDRGNASCLKLRLLARRTQENTKAEAEFAVRRVKPVARSRPTIPGDVAAPPAATVHAAQARCSTTRVRHATTRVISMPVLAPLK